MVQRNPWPSKLAPNTNMDDIEFGSRQIQFDNAARDDLPDDVWLDRNNRQTPIRHMATDHLIATTAMLWRKVTSHEFGFNQLDDEPRSRRQLTLMFAEVARRRSLEKKR